MSNSTCKHDSRLVLTNRVLSNRTANLFAELVSNESLRDAFIDTPAEIIGKEVLGESFTRQQASAVNRFIYSVLSNEDLLKWVSEYQIDERDKETSIGNIDRHRRTDDLAKAFIKYGDQSLMTSLIEIASTGAIIPGVDNASVIVKADSVAVGNWFVYKVSGRVFGDDILILPPAQVQVLAEALVKRAQELKQAGVLANSNFEVR